jgi:chromate reductase, NAD(P)H dehydrogenase (quinone)
VTSPSSSEACGRIQSAARSHRHLPSLRLRHGLGVVEIGHLPLCSQDGEADPPESWTEFRKRVKAAQAVLFVTPEHNRSMPAAMKSAVDIGSRPDNQNTWSGKPGAVISASPGAIGGFGANHHLHPSLMAVKVRTMPQPEAYLGGADKLFDASGQLSHDATRQFRRGFVEAVAAWIADNPKPDVGRASVRGF